MVRSFVWTLLLWYSAGVLMLGGDFSLIGELRSMYAHCKATEDRDMDWFDFITDHLVNFDALADSHPVGDHQRPHHPAHPKDHTGAPEVIPMTWPVSGVSDLAAAGSERSVVEVPDAYAFEPLDHIFRPPIG